MGANLAGLAKHLDLPFFSLHDGELMLGHERGHLEVYKNAKIKDFSHNFSLGNQVHKSRKILVLQPMCTPLSFLDNLDQCLYFGACVGP